MSESNKDVMRGILLPIVLTLVLIILKLTGVISISWWTAFSPIWIVGLIIVALTVIYSIVFAMRKRK